MGQVLHRVRRTTVHHARKGFPWAEKETFPPL